MPVQISLGDVVAHRTEYLNNISFGGLSFRSGIPVEKGTRIKIKIPLVRPIFEADGKVIWCRKGDGTFDVGVKFISPGDNFKIRMLEQVCHIQSYKTEVYEKEKRVLTGEQAALEWIKKYADKFPRET